LPPEILAAFTMVPDITRGIEQVGSAYEKLKVRIAKQRSKQEERKGG
jgi:hypothetical protein